MGPINHESTQEPSQMVTVKVVHAIYNTSIDVQVSPVATMLDVRKAVSCVAGSSQLEDVLLVVKTDENFNQLPDEDLLQNRRELLALGGCSVFTSHVDHDDRTGNATEMSTRELLKVGRAVAYTGKRPVADGEIVRVETDNLEAGGSFFIQLISEEGDVLLHWHARADRKEVVRSSCIRGSWGCPPVREVAGGWPHGKTKHAVIDFERSALKWKISINGMRLPNFDFAHRAPGDVTQIKMAGSLANAQAILILHQDNDVLRPTVEQAPPQTLTVTHAVYGRSIQVVVPRNAKMEDVRHKILKKTGATRHDEVLLVERAGRLYGRLPDHELLKGRSELLALGCNSAFVLGVDTTKSQLSQQLEPAWTNTKDLREWNQAVDFPTGREVLVGETVRVEADGWTGGRASSKSLNTFSIDLISDDGDIVLHWGARYEMEHVVRNSRIGGKWQVDGRSPAEETVGGWPHGGLKDLLFIDFTRTAFNWKIHVNGVRWPDFDYAHRMSDDVTKVHVSNNLRNPKILLVSHANNKLESPRQFILWPTHLSDQSHQHTLDKEFRRGPAIKDGETIRVEAQWWDKAYSARAQSYNAFFVDLKSRLDDVVLHWGARPQQQMVVRNSMFDGSWGEEETKGGWPHWRSSGEFFGDNVCVDFKRTSLKWIVSVNGQRVPDFDYMHRTSDDVTYVAVSDSLCNVKVKLIESKASERSRGPELTDWTKNSKTVGWGSLLPKDSGKQDQADGGSRDFPRLLGNSPESKDCAAFNYITPEDELRTPIFSGGIEQP